ncbi:MAG: hypothetical protein JSV60_06740, partial [Desulfobacterales bacterium]
QARQRKGLSRGNVELDTQKARAYERVTHGGFLGNLNRVTRRDWRATSSLLRPRLAFSFK